MNIIVIHGPNLNALGWREPDVYGVLTLDAINDRIRQRADSMGANVDFFQSNHEGSIVDRIQQARSDADGIVINPAAYTHTSIAIRDALSSLVIPVIEVHLSNVYAREDFRHHSVTAPVVSGQIAGLGWRGYLYALEAVSDLLHDRFSQQTASADH